MLKEEAKLEFLRKCASLGLTSAEILQAATALKQQLEKRAVDPVRSVSDWVNPMAYLKSLSDTGKSVVDFGGSVAQKGLTYGVGLPLGLAAGGGMLAGSVLAKATGPQQTAEEIKSQEKADTYRQYADYLRQRAATAKVQREQQVRGPSFR